MTYSLTSKCVVYAFVLILGFSLSSKAHALEPTSEQRGELIALVKKWIDAEVNSDREALSSLLHDDFVSTFSSGKTINKTEYLDFIIGLEIPPFTVKNEVMFIHGDTAVVVDVSGSGKTKFTYIAQKQGADWLVLAQTFTSVKQE